MVVVVVVGYSVEVAGVVVVVVLASAGRALERRGAGMKRKLYL